MWKSLRNNLRSRPNLLFGTTLGASGTALFSSYLAEAAGRLPACHLCQIQRLIFVFLFVLSIFGFFRRFVAAVRTGCLVLLTSGICVATYHSLVQYGMLKDRCSGLSNMPDIASFESSLMRSTSSGCSARSWTILGMPVSVLSGCLSFSLFLLMGASSRKSFVFLGRD